MPEPLAPREMTSKTAKVGVSLPQQLPIVVKLNQSHTNLLFTTSRSITSGHEIMPVNDLGLKYVSI
jgi:hypothetical protein